MGSQLEGGSLLILQGHIKRDPEGYRDEFLMQLRHYRAALAIFSLKPQGEAKEFADSVMFLAQVSSCYPQDMAGFPQELMGLLDTHSLVLNPSLRKNLVQALILLRNRQVVGADVLLPLFFRLFRCTDKALRHLLFSHIVQDIRRFNLKHKDDRLNRSIQNFLYGMVQDENETAAKKSLAVLIELYRRQVWTDAKTVNVICSACFHKATRIMVAALKFFLGTDQSNDDSEGESEEDEPKKNPVALDREMVYKAFNKGTRTSKRKKQAKLQRVLHGLKKQQRSNATGGPAGQASFAALHLLNDPQGFADKLFARLRTCNERFEVKLMMMNVISRAIGTHRLLVLNFYPFLQRYVQPHQRDVTHLLAAAVQACHDQVPPDVVEPLLRQLVNQFVHDRARTEVIAVGLNTIREMCTRMPLLMSEELLKDLALYKKAREKVVVSAARSIIALFRELAPSMLEKKDRGKGADLSAAVKAYGASEGAAENVPGLELLMEPSEDEDEGESEEEGDDGSGGSEDEDEIADANALEEDEVGSEEDGEDAEDGSELGSEVDEEMEGSEGDAADFEMRAQKEEGEGEGEEEGEDGLPSGSGRRDPQGLANGKAPGGAVGGSEHEGTAEMPGVSGQQQTGERGRGTGEPAEAARGGGATGPAVEAHSLRALKKLAALKATEAGDGEPEGGGVEADGFLSTEDFQHIRKLQAKRAAETALVRHGLKKGRKQSSVPEPLLPLNRTNLGERRVDPSVLEASMKKKREKEDRMASVQAGREGREFCAKAALKQKKTGGLTNREKQRRKAVPLGVHRQKIKTRLENKKRGKGRSNQFKGKKAWKS